MSNIKTVSPIETQTYNVLRVYTKHYENATGIKESVEYSGKSFEEANNLVAMLNRDKINDITEYFVCRPNVKYTKYTQGPWNNSLVGIKDKNGKLIAQAWCGDTNDSFGNHPSVGYSEMNANAKLIAAAPEMLEALELFIELKTKVFYHSLTEHQKSLFDQVLVPAQQAVTKAKGSK